uniref:Uncharacterized protein n=1 Tax=Oncorhynchus kisutch TaxID=8019 RepID=A0A8C7N0M0_ONCKI
MWRCLETFSKEEPLATQNKLIGYVVLLILRFRGQYLYDENGNSYLDCISNVQHVGSRSSQHHASSHGADGPSESQFTLHASCTTL